MGNLRYEIDQNGRMVWVRDSLNVSPDNLLFGNGRVADNVGGAARSIRNEVLEDMYADLLAEEIAQRYNHFREQADAGIDVHWQLENAISDANTLQNQPTKPAFGGGLLGAYANEAALDRLREEFENQQLNEYQQVELTKLAFQMAKQSGFFSPELIEMTIDRHGLRDLTPFEYRTKLDELSNYAPFLELDQGVKLPAGATELAIMAQADFVISPI